MQDYNDVVSVLEEMCDANNSDIVELPPFQCNHVQIRLFYTREYTPSILHISFMLEQEYVVCAFYLIHNKIDSYIPPELFPLIKKTFVFNGRMSTNEFFEVVRQHILFSTDTDITVLTRNEFATHVRGGVAVNVNHDCKYFNHLRKASVSKDMVRKIYRMCNDRDEAYKIVKYLRAIKKTLVFVDDYDRGRNLTLANVTALYKEHP